MSTRIQQTQLLTSALFLQQLQGSLYAAAIPVFTEGAGVTNHANRLAFARGIVASGAQQAAFFAPAVLSQAGVLSDLTANVVGASGTVIQDANCDAAVGALFNVYATWYAAGISTFTTLPLLGT
jgi:hypothetical protein